MRNDRSDRPDESAERTCVYDIVLNGEVIYVGMTKQPNARMLAHRRSGVAPVGSKMVVHRWFETKREALDVELERQNDLRPINCRHRTKGDPRGFDWDDHAEKTGQRVPDLEPGAREHFERVFSGLCKTGRRHRAVALADALMEGRGMSGQSIERITGVGRNGKPSARAKKKKAKRASRRRT